MKTTTATQIEDRLLGRRQPGFPDGFVLPDYAGYSIANIAPTIARMFDVNLEGPSPPLPEHLWAEVGRNVECVVLLLLDAVGYLQLKRYMAAEPSLFTRLARRGQFFPITSVFPSTTVSALSSIRTGRSPLDHGFLGTKLLLSEQGVLANLLKMAPAAYAGAGRLEKWGWEAADFVTVPSLAQQLGAARIGSVVHTRRHFIGSTLTQVLLQGVDDLQGYLHLSDLWINLRRTLNQRPVGQRLFVDVYWSGVDDTGHTYGPDDEYMPSALRHFSRSMEQDLLSSMTPEARRSTLLIVAADHGQIATPAEKVVYLPDHPGLRETLLLPPAGESRAAYLYLRRGQRSALRSYVAENLADRFVLLDTDRALEAGLWGHTAEITPTVRGRLGDMVLTARHDAQLSSREKEVDRTPLRGHHGGLTAQEMLVPLLMARLDQLWS